MIFFIPNAKLAETHLLKEPRLITPTGQLRVHVSETGFLIFLKTHNIWQTSVLHQYFYSEEGPFNVLLVLTVIGNQNIKFC